MEATPALGLAQTRSVGTFFGLQEPRQCLSTDPDRRLRVAKLLLGALFRVGGGARLRPRMIVDPVSVGFEDFVFHTSLIKSITHVPTLIQRQPVDGAALGTTSKAEGNFRWLPPTWPWASYSSFSRPLYMHPHCNCRRSALWRRNYFVPALQPRYPPRSVEEQIIFEQTKSFSGAIYQLPRSSKGCSGHPKLDALSDDLRPISECIVE